MALLNYEVLKKSGYEGFILEHAPEKVMQFGEGNFLRAFVDDFFDIANEKAGFNGKVVLVQPIAQGLTEYINNQQGLYTLYLRGMENGQKVSRKGIDVSSFQGQIDWNAVASAGVKFAMIRVGGRGYGAEGKLYADDLNKDSFLDEAHLAHYKSNDFHRMYICEIEHVFERD